MTPLARPAASLRARPAAPAQDTRPRAPFDLAWLTAQGRPEWQTRMLPLSPAIQSACASMARGALLTTPQGPVAIEDLIPGMKVTTATGGIATIRWIGARCLPEGTPSDGRPPLYRVSTGAFGHDAPAHDLVLAGSAAVLVRTPACRKLIGQDHAFAPITAFEDSYNVTRIAPVGEVTIYNIAFDGQEAVIANGLPVESFHPGRNTMQFLNDEVLRDMARLFPHLDRDTGFGPQRILHLSLTEARSLELF
jgi:hypothetical protein